MCMITDNSDMKKIKNTKHLEIVQHNRILGVFYDVSYGLYYVSKLDMHLNPLRLYDGSKEQIDKFWKLYITKCKLDWSLLDD